MESLSSLIDSSGIWKNSIGDTVDNYYQHAIMDTGVYSYFFNTPYPCSVTVTNSLYVEEYPKTTYNINNDTLVSSPYNNIKCVRPY